MDLSDSIADSHFDSLSARKSLVVGSSQSERDLMRHTDLFKMEQKDEGSTKVLPYYKFIVVRLLQRSCRSGTFHLEMFNLERAKLFISSVSASTHPLVSKRVVYCLLYK